MKSAEKILTRILILVLAAALEILFLYFVLHYFLSISAWIEIVLRILSVVILLAVIRNSRHLSFDMLFVLTIVMFPVAGTLLYCLLGADLLSARILHRIIDETKRTEHFFVQDEEVLNEVKKEAPQYYSQLRYIVNQGYPVYRNTGFSYYPLGEEGWPVMLAEMRKAKRYIFLEYFIIEQGKMWDAMLAVLEQKAKEGVECRVMYDDLGSLQTVPASYAKQLEQRGIRAAVFNRVSPLLNVMMNHRNHRKIMVIDGVTAFSGGVNLADEYINARVRYGHWKDNVIRIRGQAVWSMLCLFLTDWNSVRHEDDDYAAYRGEAEEGEADGYIAPYGETPLDRELTAQNIYMNLLNQASDYVYIMTPYLIIDTDMINCLLLAAARGVDVHIVTPGVPDKKIVYGITRSYYETLIRGGVHIHEYTPGFVHAKVFVSDERAAVVGTVNLDYRSLYLHFENGIYLLDSAGVSEVAQDVRETMKKSREVTLKETLSHPVTSFFYSVMRLFASQM